MTQQLVMQLDENLNSTISVLCIFSASDDYEGIEVSLTFAADEIESREKCLSVEIIADLLVEETEGFILFINTSDPSVMIARSSSSVILHDSSGKKYGLLRLVPV